LLQRVSPEVAHCCRHLAVQQVISYLGYTGYGASSFAKAARDPQRHREIPLGKRYVGG